MLPPVRITEHLYLVSRKDIHGPDIAHGDVFVVDCGNEAVLIDAGPGQDTYEPLKKNLQSLGLWGKLKACLVTHIHEDHASGILNLRRDNIPVYASQAAAEYTQNLPLVRKHYRDEPPVIDHILKDGEILTFGDVKFLTVYTPGHTAGCTTWIAKIDGLHCAFTGDLLFPDGAIGWSGGFDFNADSLMKSLQRLMAMEIDAVFTGHQWEPEGPEDFWLNNAKRHIKKAIDAGREGRWKLEK